MTFCIINQKEGKKRIIYFTQNWVSNIGNLFIDLGALISLDEAVKFCESETFRVIPVGTLNLWSVYIYAKESLNIKASLEIGKTSFS